VKRTLPARTSKARKHDNTKHKLRKRNVVVVCVFSQKFDKGRRQVEVAKALHPLPMSLRHLHEKQVNVFRPVIHVEVVRVVSLVWFLRHAEPWLTLIKLGPREMSLESAAATRRIIIQRNKRSSTCLPRANVGIGGGGNDWRKQGGRKEPPSQHLKHPANYTHSTFLDLIPEFTHLTCTYLPVMTRKMPPHSSGRIGRRRIQVSV